MLISFEESRNYNYKKICTFHFFMHYTWDISQVDQSVVFSVLFFPFLYIGKTTPFFHTGNSPVLRILLSRFDLTLFNSLFIVLEKYQSDFIKPCSCIKFVSLVNLVLAISSLEQVFKRSIGIAIFGSSRGSSFVKTNSQIVFQSILLMKKKTLVLPTSLSQRTWA